MASSASGMLSEDKIIRETSPLGIFFVKSGSGGNRLLFRYPFDESYIYDPDLLMGGEPFQVKDRLQFQSVINESDEALCNMFSVHPNLCGEKFEIKIGSVRHVGHPQSLMTPTNCSFFDAHSRQQRQQNHHHNRAPGPGVNLDLAKFDSLTAPSRNLSDNQGDVTSFNIVCALRASASFDVVDCYHQLCKRLASGLSFEERRDEYLSKEIRTILSALEENDMKKLTAENERNDMNYQTTSATPTGASDTNGFATTNDSPEAIRSPGSSESIFSVILERSNLARELKQVFNSLSTTGIVDLKLNNFVKVSFCLPQKAHRLKLLTHRSMPAIGKQSLENCLNSLKPYHGMLLLQEPHEILNSLPIDASPATIQLLKVTRPDKNLFELSVDANLHLMQVRHIVSMLVYWAKATVIYPICDSSIYAIHPLASTGLNSKLVSDFKTRFPSNKPLHHYLAEFSEGISMSQLNGPLLSLEEKSNLLSIVTWLLQRRILTQIHKYIFLIVDKEPPNSKLSDVSSSNQPSIANEVNASPQQQGIVINVSSNSQGQSNGLRGFSSIPSNSFESSPRMLKNSYSDSIDSSFRRYRADSLAESQEDSNFGLNSSLSSTPNSNLEYPSPGNEVRLSFSSSCPLDNPMSLVATGTIMSALQRAGLSQAGARQVLSIPSSKNVEDLKLLIKLMPYFNGRHHVEDIMFGENLERSQVLILCDKFRDILFTAHYEDMAVSQLCPFTNAR